MRDFTTDDKHTRPVNQDVMQDFVAMQSTLQFEELSAKQSHVHDLPSENLLSLNVESVRQAVDTYERLGWPVIPVIYQDKRPIGREWQKRRIHPSDFDQVFGQSPVNVGIKLGSEANNLVDVDLDSKEAEHFAASTLPGGAAVFGRASKPRSHYLYLLDQVPDKTLTFKDPADGAMLFELRVTGQTVLPPSIHKSREKIEFQTDVAPLAFSASNLLIFLEKLRLKCLVELTRFVAV